MSVKYRRKQFQLKAYNCDYIYLNKHYRHMHRFYYLMCKFSKYPKFFINASFCPNTEFFLIHIFPYSVQIWKNTDQKKLRIWTFFAQYIFPLMHSFLIFFFFLFLGSLFEDTLHNCYIDKFWEIFLIGCK